MILKLIKELNNIIEKGINEYFKFRNIENKDIGYYNYYNLIDKGIIIGNYINIIRNENFKKVFLL